MTVSLDMTPSRSLDSRTRKINGTLFLARGDKASRLSGVAADVWRLMDGTRTLQEIITTVGLSYDVDEATLTADVQSLVAGFFESGLATPNLGMLGGASPSSG